MATQSPLFSPSRMGYTGLHEVVHIDTCDSGNGNNTVIRWVLCLFLVATVMAKSFGSSRSDANCKSVVCESHVDENTSGKIVLRRYNRKATLSK